MPDVATSVSDLISRLTGIVDWHEGRFVIDEVARPRADGIRDLAWTAAFSDDPKAVEVAQWIVWEAAQELGARSASIHELYMARGRGEIHGFTVPAVNLRTQVFDMARSE